MVESVLNLAGVVLALGEQNHPFLVVATSSSFVDQASYRPSLIAKEGVAPSDAKSGDLPFDPEQLVSAVVVAAALEEREIETPIDLLHSSAMEECIYIYNFAAEQQKLLTNSNAIPSSKSSCRADPGVPSNLDDTGTGTSYIAKLEFPQSSPDIELNKEAIHLQDHSGPEVLPHRLQQSCNYCMNNMVSLLIV